LTRDETLQNFTSTGVFLAYLCPLRGSFDRMRWQLEFHQARHPHPHCHAYSDCDEYADGDPHGDPDR
jgi:hypothetical protein